MKKIISLCMTLVLLASFTLPAAAANVSHTVVKGDTMWKIAAKYQVGTSEVISANPQISNPDLIYPGQVLTIPQLDSSVASFESEVVRLVNEQRVQKGLQPLRENWELSRVARYKSQDMVDNRYFSHTSPTYGSPFQMIRAFGLSFRTAGEKYRLWAENSPGGRERLDEFQRPQSQYSKRLLYPDRRGLCGERSLLDADVYWLKGSCQFKKAANQCGWLPSQQSIVTPGSPARPRIQGRPG